MKLIASIRPMAQWVWTLDTRLLEMFLGWSFLRRGFLWLTGASDLSASVYVPLTKIMGETSWGVVLLSFGVFQIACVIINGRWRRSPFLRMVALAFSLTIYMVLAISFFQSGMGGSIQSSSQQLQFAFICAYCLLNIAYWNGQPNDRRNDK